MAVDDNGALFGWGSDSSGQLCISTEGNQLTPVKISAPKNVVQTSAGDGFSLIMTSDDKAYGCGSNSNTQLGLGAQANTDTPVLIPLAAPGAIEVVGHTAGILRQVAAGPERTLLLTTGEDTTGIGSSAGSTSDKTSTSGIGSSDSPTGSKGTGSDNVSKPTPSTTSKPSPTPTTPTPALRGNVRIGGTGVWDEPLNALLSGWNQPSVNYTYTWAGPDGTVLSRNPAFTPNDPNLIGSAIHTDGHRQQARLPLWYRVGNRHRQTDGNTVAGHRRDHQQ